MWQARTKAIVVCTILIGLYNDWLLGPWLDSRLPTRYSLISELSARTQTYHWAFQTLDIGAGILTLMILPWLWRFLRQAQVTYSVFLFLTIAGIGADSILDALLPISCAPTADIHCSLAATHSLLTQAHLVESTAIGIATFIAPLVWWWSCRIRQHLIARPSLWFVTLQIVAGASILLTRAMHYDIVGIIQRVYQFGIGAWIVDIIYVALVTTAKQRANPQSPQPELEQTPAPALVLSYDE